MAPVNNKHAIFFNCLVLIISLTLVLSLAEGRLIEVDLAKPRSVKCAAVVGVRSGDTCAGIAIKFSVPQEVFSAINPNLACDALFVGQWLCVDGTLN